LGGDTVKCKMQIANCKLGAVRPSPLTPLPKVEGTIGSARRETASGFLLFSWFIVHRSSLIPHHSSFRRGVTLVEILIVVSIIVILTAASLKLITPAEERRVREAARAVNVYISSARSRAIETGRPCGVIFHRSSGTNFPSAATVLDQCEVPPPYAGDTTDAVVKIMTDPIVPTNYRIQIRDGDFSGNLIRPGDLIQLNNQGPFYSIAVPDPLQSPPDFKLDGNGFFDFTGTATTAPWIDSNYLTVTLTADTPMQALPWSGTWSAPVVFNIIRQPVKSSAEPLQLPAGSVVDLDFSGTEPKVPVGVSPPAGSYYVAVMFSSAGDVDSYYENTTRFGVSGPIYFLVGSRSRVRDFFNQPLTKTPNLNDLPNWADLSSVWVTINYQTGLVATDENYAINFATQGDPYSKLIDWTIAPNWNYSNTSNWGFFVYLSRTYARQSQSMGGR
jgi:prepilin-type N-terminal cleavage/methylation domain-containing protein